MYKINESQVLAMWCKTHWKSYNVIRQVYRYAVNMSIQMSLYILTYLTYAEGCLFKECCIPWSDVFQGRIPHSEIMSHLLNLQYECGIYQLSCPDCNIKYIRQTRVSK